MNHCATLYFSISILFCGCGAGTDSTGPMIGLRAKIPSNAVYNREGMQPDPNGNVTNSGEAAAERSGSFIGVAAGEIECPTVDMLGSNLVAALNLGCDTSSGGGSIVIGGPPVAVASPTQTPGTPAGRPDMKVPDSVGNTNEGGKDLLADCNHTSEEGAASSANNNGTASSQTNTNFCDTTESGSIEIKTE